jgi:hypothetical protein
MNTDAPRAITADEITTYHRDGVILLLALFDGGWIELLNKGLTVTVKIPAIAPACGTAIQASDDMQIRPAPK